MTADISALDTPLPQVEADARRLAALRSLDPFARLACEHPEACTCADAAPAEWAERIARLAARNKQFGRAS